ncbi:MAG: sigma-70 family RNA polymerase sigma factor [Actinobacteria bacterium]|nr:sigma-70 family RNA polymerase sigma factor [Actinomycetota bacterium]
MGGQNDDVVAITRAIRAKRIARADVFGDGSGHHPRAAAEPEVTLPNSEEPAVNDLVEDHLWLVDRMTSQAARRFPRYVERNELWSAGVLGLVEAARRYNASYNVPFAAYASSRVRGEMLEVVRSGDVAPRRLRRSLRELATVVEALTQELGRVPTLAEVATAAEIDVNVVRERMYSAAILTSTSLDDDDSQSQSDGALATMRTEPTERLAQRELIGALREAVSQLPEPLKSVLVRSNWNNERLVDIAQDMGISFQRVAQYKSEAVTALAAWFATLYESVPTPEANLPGAVRRAAFCAALAANSSWRARLEAGADRDGVLDSGLESSLADHS